MQRITVILRIAEKPGSVTVPRRWVRGVPTSSDPQDDMIRESREFRQISLSPAKKERRRFEERKSLAHDLMPPRAQRMQVNQDWPSVWPAAATFKPATVPLPVHMSHNPERVPLNKFGNAELMKIPNFFHLTPVAVQTHCAALKKFCTPWPKELDSDEKCKEYFPTEIVVSDYCHAGSSIRNTQSRIVSLRVKLAALDMDFHARDKFLRLIGDRYDPQTGYVTFISDRCPTRKQNVDYAKYLLTALYFESWKVEPWEAEKTLADHERYYWDAQPSKKTISDMMERMDEEKEPRSSDSSSHLTRPPGINPEEKMKNYKVAVEDLMNNGEDLRSLEKYKTSVEKLFGFS